MTQIRQKVSERQFAREAGKMLGKTWNLEEHETPDFIVTEGANKFGLEVCQIFTGQRDKKGSRSKRNEAENQKRIDEYRLSYEEKENALLDVQLVGDTCDENMEEVVRFLIEREFSNKPFGYHEEFEVPFDIEDLVAEIMKSGCHKKLTVKEIMESEYRERFEALIRSPSGRRLSVFATRLPNSYTHCVEWQDVGDRVGWVRSASDHIVGVIESKSKKLPEYKERTGLDDIRLLIVADHLRASGMLELRECHNFDPQGFQVVYFLNYPRSAEVISRAR